MQEPTRHTLRRAAALLLGGCAALLVSCDSKTSVANDDGVRNMMTQQSEDLTVILSRNGNLTYRFTTPLLERYEYALEPYTEFRKGIHIETYNDSTHQVESSLTANYAILLEKQQLWEAKGNVRGHNAGGNQLETEQLFWNQKSKLVYSNVDSKITQNTDVVYGDGFESDERFEEFVVRNPKGKVTVETAPNRSDTTEKAPEAAPKPDVPADVPVIREGEGVANPATIRNQRKRRDEPRMLAKPVKLERFERPGRPEADAAGSRRP